MNWTTLYIKGRSDFRQEVAKKLEHSKLKVMPGYIEATPAGGTYDLYWVSESTSLRDIKEAIGSKLVLKHRLRFFPSLEDFIESMNPKSSSLEFTDEEKLMLESIRKQA